MMITIEGPDCAGKTTMWEAMKPLLPATYVGRMPCSPELIPLMHIADARQMALWDVLYDPSKLYVLDRCPIVSGRVYDQLYGRPSYDYSQWASQLRIIYLRPPMKELLRRYAERGDVLFGADRYFEIIQLYDVEVRKHKYIVNPSLLEAIEWIAKNS